MDIITYSLANNEQNSESYYKEIAVFSDKVLTKLQKVATPIICDFVKFIKTENLEECRTNEEYMIEFLYMGVLFYVYAEKAEKLKPLPQKLLSFLSRARLKNNFIKPGIDRTRGVLLTKFLIVNKETDTKIEKLTLKDLENLLGWMEASGDFRFALERLKNWHKFLKSLPEGEAYISNVINEANALAEWFKLNGRQALGKYTSGVDRFLKDKYPEYLFREDVIFCGRKEIEYHINMVGAEILNRAFRKDFIKTTIKMVLLPACMRFNPPESCKAVHSSYGYVCTNCTTLCRVNKLTKMGIQNNFKVYMIPHESDAFSKEKIEKGKVGIVGVACILNLLEGGWKGASLKFIPQCVVLDYCGCRNHWHSKGLQTDINIQQLKRVLLL